LLGGVARDRWFRRSGAGGFVGGGADPCGRTWIGDVTGGIVDDGANEDVVGMFGAGVGEKEVVDQVAKLRGGQFTYGKTCISRGS
jgi:hypothetical protein